MPSYFIDCNEVLEAIFSTNSKILAILTNKGNCFIYEIHDKGYKLIESIQCEFMSKCIFSKDNIKLIIADGLNKKIAIYSLIDKTTLELEFNGHETHLSTIDISASYKLITSDVNKVVNIWNIDCKLNMIVNTHKIENGMNAIFNQSGEIFATICNKTYIEFWNSNTCQLILHAGTNHKAAITSVNFSKFCRKVITGSIDASIRIWILNIEIGSFYLEKILHGHHISTISDIMFNFNDYEIISYSIDGTIKKINAVTGKRISTIAEGIKGSISFHKPYLRFIAICSINTVEICEGPYNSIFV